MDVGRVALAPFTSQGHIVTVSWNSANTTSQVLLGSISTQALWRMSYWLEVSCLAHLY